MVAAVALVGRPRNGVAEVVAASGPVRTVVACAATADPTAVDPE
jgi:hypothetical protein